MEVTELVIDCVCIYLGKIYAKSKEKMRSSYKGLSLPFYRYMIWFILGFLYKVNYYKW